MTDAEPFLKDVEDYAPHRMVCRVGTVLEALDPGRRERLEQLIDNPNVSAGAITSGLERHGIMLPKATIARHRRRDCRCRR